MNHLLLRIDEKLAERLLSAGLLGKDETGIVLSSRMYEEIESLLSREESNRALLGLIAEGKVSSIV